MRNLSHKLDERKQMRGNISGREAFRVERDHHLIQARQATLPDRHDLWFERCVAIPGNLNLNLTELGANRFRVVTVPRVARATPFHSVTFVSEMVVHLDAGRALEHLANQIRQQTSLASQSNPHDLA